MLKIGINIKKIICVSLFIPIIINAQNKISPAITLNITADAELFYINFSPQISLDYQLNTSIFLSAYFQYFKKNVDRYYQSNLEKGYLETFSTALLVSYRFNKKKYFITTGVGICNYQRRENLLINSDLFIDNRNVLLPTFQASYVPKNSKFSYVFNAIGPYINDDIDGTIIEFFSQISLGIKLNL